MMTANAIVTWTTSPEHSDYIETGLWRSTIRAWFAVVLSIASGAWLSYTQGRPGQSAAWHNRTICIGLRILVEYCSILGRTTSIL